MQWLGLTLVMSVPIADLAIAVRGIGWRDTLLLTLATVAGAGLFAGPCATGGGVGAIQRPRGVIPIARGLGMRCTRPASTNARARRRRVRISMKRRSWWSTGTTLASAASARGRDSDRGNVHRDSCGAAYADLREFGASAA